MEKIHKFISRKNIYGCVLILGIILLVIYGIFSTTREIIYVIVFNPIWPALLGLFEIYIQTIEKEIAKDNERKIEALSGVIRGRLENKSERELIKSIIDSVSEKDLMFFNSNKIKQMEIDEKVEEAGEIIKKIENIKDF